MEAKQFDAFIGVEAFTTKTPGIGGRLRTYPEDFIVQEIASDGSVAPLKPSTQSYPDQAGKFIAFFLVKRNIDTIQAIRQLSKSLRISYKRFSYAGIKDRRALTSQLVTLYRGSPQDLIDLDIPRITLLHPHRVRKPILPGAHLGNRFNITIRNLEVPIEEVATRIIEVESDFDQHGGILNFFGPQRFGIFNPTTHLIGKQIILGNLEKAIDILLEKRASEDPQPFEDGEVNATSMTPLKQLQNQSYERAVTHYLAKHPGDYQGCLRVLPKGLVRLYVHAYQSYLFNRTISERIKQRIPLTHPCLGDFVMPTQGEIHAVRMVTPDTLEQAERNVLLGKQEIVIPLVGYDFEGYVFTGPIGEVVNKILADEQITPAVFRLVHLPELSSRGSFRPLQVKPTNLLSKVKEEKSELVVVISFDLPKGSYASVVMREFIKPRFVTQL